jgi:hypothetical protein
MSEKNLITIIDGSSKEVIEREFTEDELEIHNQLVAQYLEQEQVKEANRTSALAKLAALGLTEEEIAAL